MSPSSPNQAERRRGKALIGSRLRGYMLRCLWLPVLLVLLAVPFKWVSTMIQDGWGDWWVKLPISAAIVAIAAITLSVAGSPYRKAILLLRMLRSNTSAKASGRIDSMFLARSAVSLSSSAAGNISTADGGLPQAIYCLAGRMQRATLDLPWAATSVGTVVHAAALHVGSLITIHLLSEDWIVAVDYHHVPSCSRIKAERNLQRTTVRLKGKAVELAIVRFDGLSTRPRLNGHDANYDTFYLWARIGGHGAEWSGKWHWLGPAPDWVASPGMSEFAKDLRFEGDVVIWYREAGSRKHWVACDFTVSDDSHYEHVRIGMPPR